MASSTDKERLRRAAIEEAWVKPVDPVPRHDPSDDERPNTARLIIVALQVRGWLYEEMAATVLDAPRWMTAKPDDPNLSFVALPAVVYHLAGYRLPASEGVLIGVELMYVNGKITRSRLATRIPRDRPRPADALPVKFPDVMARWTDAPATSLAKNIRENL